MASRSRSSLRHAQPKRAPRGVRQRLTEFETRHSLLDETVQGYPYWATIRLNVFRSIAQGLGLIGQAHSSSSHDPGPLKRLLEVPGLLRRNNPMRAGRSDIVIWGHPRRKLEEDGLWWDLYTDPLVEGMDRSSMVLERTSKNGVCRPAKTDRLYTLDLPYVQCAVKGKLGMIRPPQLTSIEQQRLDALNGDLLEEFGIDVGLRGLVQTRLDDRNQNLEMHRKVLKRTKPKLAVVVVGYYNHDFVESCKKLKIPVAELQHGFIGPYHFGYSIPPEYHERVRHLFPDYFLTFGEYWNNRVDLPVPQENIFPVGYPYFELCKKRYSGVPKKKQILFISQGIHGARLSKMAVRIALQKASHRHDVVYKLHPGEYQRWRKEYPWLINSPVQVVDSDRPHLYRLFAESSIQVGCSSTALYEGMGFGLRTLLYRPLVAQGMHDLVESGSARYFDSEKELVGLVNAREGLQNDFSARFFADRAHQRFQDAVEFMIEASAESD